MAKNVTNRAAREDSKNKEVLAMSHRSPNAVTKQRIRNRLKSGWTLKDAVEKPRVPIFKYSNFVDWETCIQNAWRNVNEDERPLP